MGEEKRLLTTQSAQLKAPRAARTQADRIVFSGGVKVNLLGGTLIPS